MKKLYYFFVLFVALSFFSATNIQAAGLSEKLSGKILLQVEQNGEAWYVNPANQNRYFLNRPNDAFAIMRDLGVGIKDSDLQKIPIADMNLNGTDSDGDGLSDMAEDAFGTDKNNPDSDGDTYNDKQEIIGAYNPLGGGKLAIDENFSQKQIGKIFLQIEKHGEAWYINPQDNKRYFLGRPDDAFNLMRSVGLGIKDADLAKITKFGDNSNSNNTNNSSVNTDTTTQNTQTQSTQIPSDEKWIMDIIVKHEDDVLNMTKLLEKTSSDEYLSKVSDYFAKNSVTKAKKQDDEFFESFQIDTLSWVASNGISQEAEIFFESSDNAKKPYVKINDEKIRVGLKILDIIPYDLVKENGVWKIDLDVADDYYDDYISLEDKQFDSFEGEFEVDLMKKTKEALGDYKAAKGSYPTDILDVTFYNPSLKSFLEDLSYAYNSNSNPQNYHLGVEIYDENSSLNRDDDFDSESQNYIDGFSGEDPIYDIKE